MYIKNVFARLWYEPSSKKKIYHKMACTDGCRNRMHVVTGSGSRIDRLKMRESTSALGILAKILRPFKLQLNVFFFFLNTEGKWAPQCDWQTLPVWDVREGGAGGLSFQRDRNVWKDEECPVFSSLLSKLHEWRGCCTVAGGAWHGEDWSYATSLHTHTHTHTQEAWLWVAQQPWRFDLSLNK